MQIHKYSFGTGDRFAHQGVAQLRAVEMAREKGVDLAIVWNKSHREHTIVETTQLSVRQEADKAVRSMGWTGQHFVDADHINMENVDLFMDHSDFFTLDVADHIGSLADDKALDAFVDRFSYLIGELRIAGIGQPVNITEKSLRESAEKYLLAIQEAGRIYRHIVAAKGAGAFVTEVSMDETAEPQSPEELLFILAAVSSEGIPAQTIAPKFSGRFNKGVDYQGDLERFSVEFEQDLCIINHAVEAFGLPPDLKLSVHSGSDKFSIYGPIRKLIRQYDTGIHIKTAGTTWLEELIGLAEAGGNGLDIAKQIYASAYERFDELCGPYSSVIDIDRERLPLPGTVNSWTGGQYVRSLRHDQACPDYDLNVRQLLHVGYKVAAEMGSRYLDALEANAAIVAKNVTENLYNRHITPLFL